MLTFKCADTGCENLDCISSSRDIQILCWNGAEFYTCLECAVNAFQQKNIKDATDGQIESVMKIERLTE